jgi:hypothetical protein
VAFFFKRIGEQHGAYGEKAEQGQGVHFRLQTNSTPTVNSRSLLAMSG